MPQDDTPLFIARKDFSGGVNTRQHAAKLAENQVSVLDNGNISIGGQVSKRLGYTKLSDLGASAGTGLFGFEPDGGTNELFATLGVSFYASTGATSAWVPYTSAFASAFTSNLMTTMIKAGMSGQGDIIILSNGTNECYRMLQNHSCSALGDLNTSPPLSTVMTYFRNRVWVLKNNFLYYSDAYPANYSLAFDRTTNAYRMSVGTARAVLGLRDLGLIVLGADQVWGLNPSNTPAATDKPEKILDIGCVAGNTACIVGDDVYFLSPDGVRGVFRTQQDKLQLGQSYPLSYALKTEYDIINWSYIHRACAVYFDNKYFIAIPVNSSTYNNRVCVYTPASQSWVVYPNVNVGAWSKLKVSGEEKLYYIEANDGIVHRFQYGVDDNGTVIPLTIEGREEDLGQPYIFKTGGEIEIEARQTEENNQSLTIDAAVDESTYTNLGTMDISGSVSTKLLLHCDGLLGSTIISDEVGHTVTNVGSKVTIDTALKKFGTGSALFNGVDAYLTIANSSVWSDGTSDFTKELQVSFVALPAALSYATLLDLQYDTGIAIRYFQTMGGVTPAAGFQIWFVGSDVYFPWSPVLGTLYHLAIIRSGNKLSVYVNGTHLHAYNVAGVLLGDYFDVTGKNMSLPAAAVAIGANVDGNSFFSGNMDEIRFSKGIARWTADFTAPIAAYSYDSYTEYALKRKKFHLEPLGRFKTIKPKISHNTACNSNVILYGYSIASYPEVYESE